jgi:hypothetical protein
MGLPIRERATRLATSFAYFGAKYLILLGYPTMPGGWSLREKPAYSRSWRLFLQFITKSRPVSSPATI